MSLIHKLKRNLTNIPGATVNKKIVVIESDDWGSVRMPSLVAYKDLQQQGLDMNSGDSARYNQNDTLASSKDLSCLYKVLTNFKDHLGNHPVITPITIVANPDFVKIKEHNFKKYYCEPFTKTLKAYHGDNVFEIWKEGIEKKIFVPQFHGREHLNIAAWMRALQKNDKETVLAFDCGVWGYTNKHPLGLMYQAAFDLEVTSDLKLQHEVIESGLNVFEELFGYKASYFVPPNGPFNTTLEAVAAQKGIQYMFASKIQKEVLGGGVTRNKYYWLGKKNKHGQLYLTRNCFFEPSNTSKNWVKSCLEDINRAFRWKKPAVISSHRVNFIGSLNIKNRESGLDNLEQLLKAILLKWPDVEFKTSAELGGILAKK